MDKWTYRMMKEQERADDAQRSLNAKPVCKFPEISCPYNTAFNGYGGILKCNYKGECVKEAQ